MPKFITDRERRFILEYLGDPDRNATQACRHAGYSKNPNTCKTRASQLLKTDYIQVAIEDELKRRDRRMKVDSDGVVTGILETIENAEKAGTGAWQASIRMRGWELLGKYLGIFTDKVEVGLDNKVMELLAAGRKRAADEMTLINGNAGMLTDGRRKERAEEQPRSADEAESEEAGAEAVCSPDEKRRLN